MDRWREDLPQGIREGGREEGAGKEGKESKGGVFTRYCQSIKINSYISLKFADHQEKHLMRDSKKK